MLGVSTSHVTILSAEDGMSRRLTKGLRVNFEVLFTDGQTEGVVSTPSNSLASQMPASLSSVVVASQDTDTNLALGLNRTAGQEATVEPSSVVAAQAMQQLRRMHGDPALFLVLLTTEFQERQLTLPMSLQLEIDLPVLQSMLSHREAGPWGPCEVNGSAAAAVAAAVAATKSEGRSAGAPSVCLDTWGQKTREVWCSGGKTSHSDENEFVRVRGTLCSGLPQFATHGPCVLHSGAGCDDSPNAEAAQAPSGPTINSSTPVAVSPPPSVGSSDHGSTTVVASVGVAIIALIVACGLFGACAVYSPFGGACRWRGLRARQAERVSCGSLVAESRDGAAHADGSREVGFHVASDCQQPGAEDYHASGLSSGSKSSGNSRQVEGADCNDFEACRLTISSTLDAKFAGENKTNATRTIDDNWGCFESTPSHDTFCGDDSRAITNLGPALPTPLSCFRSSKSLLQPLRGGLVQLDLGDEGFREQRVSSQTQVSTSWHPSDASSRLSLHTNDGTWEPGLWPTVRDSSSSCFVGGQDCSLGQVAIASPLGSRGAISHLDPRHCNEHDASIFTAEPEPDLLRVCVGDMPRAEGKVSITHAPRILEPCGEAVDIPPRLHTIGCDNFLEDFQEQLNGSQKPVVFI